MLLKLCFKKSANLIEDSRSNLNLWILWAFQTFFIIQSCDCEKCTAHKFPLLCKISLGQFNGLNVVVKWAPRWPRVTRQRMNGTKILLSIYLIVKVMIFRVIKDFISHWAFIVFSEIRALKDISNCLICLWSMITGHASCFYARGERYPNWFNSIFEFRKKLFNSIFNSILFHKNSMQKIIQLKKN